ncbi:hypothetical protein [Massilia sp. TS11]|uniref:hypothetical protein n=1 Tax=Massilia sp. TS11 TaxID=2908003 RepID=UPI001EDA2933|nr:hypothetical protein [Massilia sp. TS11]MCG2585989.1 hypothetical protein [Massilia sp. TS11]
MFEKTVLRRAVDGLPLTQGQLAEAMLYYQSVHVVFDAGTLLSLIKAIGADQLIALLKRGNVTGVYCDEYIGTSTEGSSATQCHNFIAFNVAGDDYGSALKTAADRIEFNTRRSEGFSKKESQQFAKNFLDLVPVRTYSSNYYVKGGIIATATKDLEDKAYIRDAARTVIETIPGGYSPNAEFSFDLLKSDLGYFVFTNADFDRINMARDRMTPRQDNFTPAHVLSSILEARADLSLASFYGGDFVTSGVISSIIRLKHSEILRRMQLNLQEKSHFTEIVLPDAPALCEVIDSGERTFEEFLKLLDHSRRFKDWLHKTNPDVKLAGEYLRDAKKEGWIEGVPAKGIRYMITSAIEAALPAAGPIASLADTFLIDKLLKGWRPNHFVDKKLGPFLGKR